MKPRQPTRTAASSEQGANPGRMCRARTRRSSCQPSCPTAQAFAAASCEREYGLEAVGVCARCFGPLHPVYDEDALRGSLTREAIESGPPSLWRYAPLLPVAPPAEPRLAPGLTPLTEAPRLATALGVGRLYLKLDTANPTHSFKDRVVAVAAAKALELGCTHALLLVDREPRERGRGARGRGGNRGGGLLPGRPRAGEAGRDRGLRRDDLRGRRQLRRLQPPLGRAVVRARLGVRQRRAPRLLRRGVEDAGLRDRGAARLAAPGRGRRARSPRARSSRRSTRASASCFGSASWTESGRGSTAGRRKAARPSRRRSPRTAR